MPNRHRFQSQRCESKSKYDIYFLDNTWIIFVITISQNSTDMRAILIKDGKGPIENLYIGEIATPVVKSREVLVKVLSAELRVRYPPLTSIMRKSRQITAFSLNRMDVSQRKGFYPAPQDASEILGVEFAGHVTALGPDTSGTWAIGDQVLGLASGVSQHRGCTYSTRLAELQTASFLV